MYPIVEYRSREPWNKGKLVGQKSPLKLKDIWAIRIRLQLNNKLRDLTLFNLAIDSKLRACDLTKLKVSDVAQSGRVGAALSCFDDGCGAGDRAGGGGFGQGSGCTICAVRAEG